MPTIMELSERTFLLYRTNLLNWTNNFEGRSVNELNANLSSRITHEHDLLIHASMKLRYLELFLLVAQQHIQAEMSLEAEARPTKWIRGYGTFHAKLS